LLRNFYRVVVDSFSRKLDSGLDVVNYPQHYDMYQQFLDIIHMAMEKGTYVVAEKDTVIPEIWVIKEEAKGFYEKIGRKIPLRVCITGPLELYLKEVGTTLYTDVLMMFAETVRLFAENSIFDSKYVKTEVVTLDEPSLGFQEIFNERDVLIEALERAFDFKCVEKHIHLHSSSMVSDLMKIGNLDALSLEYAASPKNIEGISKNMLMNADKKIRIGISRTDIDSITAELFERGISKPTIQQFVESKDTIRRRLNIAKRKYGETLAFVGPDCGLGGWPTQEAAELLLHRTVTAVKNASTNIS